MKALRFLRVLVAVGVFTLVTLFFLGFGGGFGLLERIQIVPALLGCAAVPLAAWVVVTLLFGRVYCSMACPLGILQDLLARLVRPLGRRSYEPRPDRPWVRVAVCCLFAALVVAGGVSLAGLLDPYSVFGRMASRLFQPAAEWADANLLSGRFSAPGAEVLVKYPREVVLVRSVSGFAVAASALSMLLLLVAWKGRLVCNTLCPVGAMLGVLSRKTALRVAIDPAKCVKCGLCSRVCKALCLDGRNQLVDNARCVRCFDCAGACPKGAISFAPAWTSCLEPAPDGSRRAFMAAAAAGTVAAGVAACGTRLAGTRPAEPTGVPPPGADRESLRTKCTGCGLCVAKCPCQVIVPAGFAEYGPLGFMMPKMDFSRAPCDPNCRTCGDVCPTGAIRPLELAAKRAFRIGLASFDRAACLACTEKIPCGLCARRCPQEAIALREEEISEGGKTVKIAVPVVDAAKCTGCGTCENYCPGHALRVSPLNV